MTDIRSRQLEGIAAQIAEHNHLQFAESATQFASRQNIEGWSIDITYGDEGPGNWTRTDGIVLTEVELARAVSWAARIGGEVWV